MLSTLKWVNWFWDALDTTPPFLLVSPKTMIVIAFIAASPILLFGAALILYVAAIMLVCAAIAAGVTGVLAVVTGAFAVVTG